MEQRYYLSKALDRQLDPDSQVSVREVKELAFAGVFFAVDTTSSVLGWNLFHVARDPRVQEILYQELQQAVKTKGKDGVLTLEALSRDSVPYLYAIFRETHRLTPPGPITVSRQIMQEGVSLFNKPMQKGDKVAMDGYSIGMDPALVDQPDKYLPERWLPDAVEARKGTPKELLDHPLLRDGFSQGQFRF